MAPGMKARNDWQRRSTLIRMLRLFSAAQPSIPVSIVATLVEVRSRVLKKSQENCKDFPRA
jgi:hypothetical protein